MIKKKKKDSPPLLSNYILMFLNSLLEYPLVLGCIKLKYLYPNLFNVLIANSLVTCNQTVTSPEYVINVVSSMKTNNLLLINQNVPTVKENTPLIVKLAPKNRKIISYEKSLSGKMYSTIVWSRNKNSTKTCK
jgi:hypothetical protein